MESDQIKPISEILPRWQAAIALLRLLGLDDKRVRRVEFSAGTDEPSILKIEYDVTGSGIAEAPQISPQQERASQVDHRSASDVAADIGVRVQRALARNT